jgi:hypothetical protein
MITIDVDTETVRLEPGPRVVWEIALITEDGSERVWQIRPDLGLADPTALAVNKYHDRIHRELVDARPGVAMRIVHPDGHGPTSERDIANEIAALTSPGPGGKVRFSGSKPDFDQRHLDAMMRWVGQCGSWYHHGLDVASAAESWCSALGVGPVSAKGDGLVRSDDWSRAIGVDPGRYKRHTALDDSRWTRAMRIAMGLS